MQFCREPHPAIPGPSPGVSLSPPVLRSDLERPLEGGAELKRQQAARWPPPCAARCDVLYSKARRCVGAEIGDRGGGGVHGAADLSHVATASSASTAVGVVLLTKVP
jgi:hypothetical protein